MKLSENSKTIDIGVTDTLNGVKNKKLQNNSSLSQYISRNIDSSNLNSESKKY